MRNGLPTMTELVQENLSRAQQTQKRWYDRTARSPQLSRGDRVLVLLPTSTDKLRAQWQGPFPIVEKRGDVNYLLDMGRRRLRTFHVNMVREWHEREPLSLFTAEATDVEADDVIPWMEVDESPPLINPTLLSTDNEAIN